MIQEEKGDSYNVATLKQIYIVLGNVSEGSTPLTTDNLILIN